MVGRPVRLAKTSDLWKLKRKKHKPVVSPEYAIGRVRGFDKRLKKLEAWVAKIAAEVLTLLQEKGRTWEN